MSMSCVTSTLPRTRLRKKIEIHCLLSISLLSVFGNINLEIFTPVLAKWDYFFFLNPGWILGLFMSIISIDLLSFVLAALQLSSSGGKKHLILEGGHLCQLTEFF